MIRGLSFLVLCVLAMGKLSAAMVTIVAAENFYGSVAEQIGGSSVRVIRILSNLNQDPHEFQIDVATAKAIADADIVIYNGLTYDNWVEKLLSVKGKPQRVVIKVADLIKALPGDNPHIWYDPKTMWTLGKRLAEVLSKPEAADSFQKSMQPLFNKIASLKTSTVGVKVTATEPIFGYMANALGFEMLNYDYQLAVMNGTDPSFQQTVNFEKCLANNTTKILFYNSQVNDPTTKRMQFIAKKHGIPVVGVTETQPPNVNSYVDWMLSELVEVEKALNP